ncbi:DUF3224 domain-containing protein [Kaarinaea lacus]
MEGITTFRIAGWDEQSFAEVEDAGKLCRASVIKTYTGEISGEGKLEYLMAYQTDGSAVFTGFERVIGTVGGKTGSFVFQHSGNYRNGEMTQESVILPGSGTGELAGIKGTGNITAGHQEEYPMSFSYDIK